MPVCIPADAMGRIKLADGSCCGCQCPDPSVGFCCHVIKFSFNPDLPSALEADEYWDRGDLIEFTCDGFSVFNVFPWFEKDGDVWFANCSVNGAFVSVEMTPEDFFGQWHDVCVQIYIQNHARGDADVSVVKLSVYDTSDEYDHSGALGTTCSQFFVGSAFANNLEQIQLKNISLMGNPTNSEVDFNFPTDSFDSTVGSGQSISSDTVIITGDASSSQVGYLKNLSPEYDFACLTCACSPITVSVSGSGHIECDDGMGGIITILDISNADGHTFTFSGCGPSVAWAGRTNCLDGCNCEPAVMGENCYGVFLAQGNVTCAHFPSRPPPLSTFVDASFSAETGCSAPQADPCDPLVDLESQWFANDSGALSDLDSGSHSFTDHFEDTFGEPCGTVTRTFDLSWTIGVP